MIQAGEALRVLSRGQRSAREVADLVGWGPRTCGPRMCCLEREGFVRRVEIHRTPRGSIKNEWYLTEKGWRLIGKRASYG